jgi:hypothetical protein
MPGFVFLLACDGSFLGFSLTPAATRPRESEMKKAAGPNGPTAKKNDLPARNRKADEIYLRLQKSAPLPTRKWLHGLYFLPIAKSLFLEKQCQTRRIHRQNPHQWQSN